MSLSDKLSQPTQSVPAQRPRPTAPKGFDPGVKYEPTTGLPDEVTLCVAEVPAEEAEWRTKIRDVTGLDIPEHRQVTLTDTRYWGAPGAENVYARFKIVDRPGVSRSDLEDIIAAAKAVRVDAPEPKITGRALVVPWADLQVGKVGSRGDTEALVDRVMTRLDLLEARAAEGDCDTAYLIDVGDCVESFENVPSQAFTNDLSFPEQLRVARRLFTDAALRLARMFPKVVCAAVPSNHGQWRRGKDRLGRPGDDFGLETLTTIADAFALNESLGHVSFVIPDVWEETLVLDVNGTILAVHHGHQANRPDGVPLWWAKQVHGGQPGADADILLTGHFHHLRVQPSGRSAHTAKAKWWIQAPTLDNGSDWFRLKAGDDSDPALLTFVVDKDGWSRLELL